MKFIKIMGLAAIAAAALMAFVASSASADVICTTSLNPCGTKITAIEASISGTAKLTDTANTVFAECTVGTVIADIEQQGNAVPPSGKITSLTWGPKGAGCNTTVDTKTNGSLELRTEGTTKAIWAAKTEVTVVAFGESCTYGAGAGTKIGTLNTGTGATMTINAIVKKTGGNFLCSETAKWTGTYAITNHSSVFVTNE